MCCISAGEPGLPDSTEACEFPGFVDTNASQPFMKEVEAY